MALIATQSPSIAGTEPTYAAASGGGDTVQPSADTFLHVKNGSGVSVTVTIVAKTPCNQGTLHDGGGAIPAGEERIFGPVSPQRFARASDGLAEVTYSATTSVTVAALK